MTQKSIKIILNEIYSKPPNRNYPTNETDVYPIDQIWSLDTLDLKGYNFEINIGYRYVLVIIDNFSNFGWTVPLINKIAQTTKVFFESTLISSNRKPKIIETDRGKQVSRNVFQDFLNKNKIKILSRNKSYGAVFAERFNKSIKNLLKIPVFERADGKWIDVLSTITKQYIYRVHNSA